MTIAYWCILIIIIFPYIFTILAKSGRHFNKNNQFDNRDPRTYLKNLTGWQKRADYVQLNSFEVHPAFSISVIIAELTHASQFNIDLLAIAFVITRILYSLCYLFNQSTLRTLSWALGMACILGFYYIIIF